MTKYSLLCSVVLIGSLLGCQKTHLEPHTEQEGHQSSTYFTQDIAFEISSDIITSVFKDLGIQMGHRDQQPGRFVVVGKSLSEESVSVNASALIIGKTVFEIEAKGQRQVSNALVNEIRNAIGDAIRDYKRDNKKS